MSYLISIVGPTGVGKTQLSLALAQRYETEILSSDSRQLYRYMDIGTAKASATERDLVPHHLIDILNPDQGFTAGQYESAAEEILTALFSHKPVVLMVGGSTLYVDALWHGIDPMPATPPEVREALTQSFQDQGLAPLLEELARVDPPTFERIDQKNHARVIRALEVYRSTGNPISFYRKGKKEKKRPYQLIKIGLNTDRKALYKTIDQRVTQMIEMGLEMEVKTLLAMGYTPNHQALQSIGYQEMISYIQGKYSLEEAISLIQRNSRRYAKRQLTYYRRYEDITWFEPGQFEAVVAWLAKRYGL